MHISLQDFNPFNTWVEHDDPALQYTNGCNMYIKDQDENLYLNEEKKVIRIKCGLLALATPIVQTLRVIVNAILKAYSLYLTGEKILKDTSFKSKNVRAIFDAVKDDLFVIALTPAILLLLEAAAIYGLIMPLDGRKLYASSERLLNDDFFLAPCFQACAVRHFFGGDIKQRNTF